MTRVVVLFLFAAAFYQARAQEITFTGQLRERTEFSGKSFVQGTSMDVYHLLRTRLNAAAKLENAGITVEIQDARLFGSEPSTLNEGNLYQRNNGGLDLTMAYLTVRDVAGTGLNAHVGRMGLEYGNYRYIGRQDASNLTVSYDGAVVSYTKNALSIDLFGAALRRNEDFFSIDDMRTIYQRDEFLTGLWSTWKSENGGYHAFVLFDNPRYVQNTQSQSNRFTLGIQGDQKIGLFAAGVEAAYQLGTTGAMPAGFPAHADIGAYFVAVRAGMQIPGYERLRVDLSIERLSGNEPPAEGTRDRTYEQFSMLYGNRFKFFGNMNVFTGEFFSSSAVRNNGLQDVSFSVSTIMIPGLSLGAVAHLFHETVDPGSYVAKNFGGYSSYLGLETDITMTWQAYKQLRVTGAFCIFDADKERASYLNIRRTTKWAYVLFLVTF